MNDQTILIRAMESRDIEAIAEILGQPSVVWGTMQVPMTSVEARRKRFEAQAPSVRSLVAEIGGRVVGNLGLMPQEPIRRSHVGYIGMAVHEDHQGRGVGQALMEAAIDLADNWLALTRLELTVYTDNARAIALYERCGFTREGVFRRYALRAGECVDCFAMARLKPD
jgi:L-phenylalanine/L-methionine N-acetyltransferase